MVVEKIAQKLFENKPNNLCHFSALQPLLSTRYPIQQIKSLLILSLLFWQKVTFTDTQIGDSPHLFREFVAPGQETLAPLMRDCFASGDARLLLRDAFYNSPGDKIAQCNDLVDVYRGWQQQNIPGAWVVPANERNRERFVEAWAEVIPKRFILTYDYLGVKMRFQDGARLAMNWTQLKEKVGDDVYRELGAVLGSSWFSHSHVFAVLNKSGLAESEWAQRFGLIDEAAYAESFDAAFAAIDLPSALVDRGHDDEKATSHINRIMSRAFKSVSVDDLRFFSLLSYEEVSRIRSRGHFLVDAIRGMSGHQELTDDNLKELAIALADYWAIICDEIARLHPGAVRRTTKLGLAVAERAVAEPLTNQLSMVLAGVTRLFSGESGPKSGALRRAFETASFRFLFTAEAPELHALRKILSRNAILSVGYDV